jgi:hypothetical protein
MKIIYKTVYGSPYLTRYQTHSGTMMFKVDYNAVTKELENGLMIFGNGEVDVPEETGYEDEYRAFVNEVSRLYLYN